MKCDFSLMLHIAVGLVWLCLCVFITLGSRLATAPVEDTPLLWQIERRDSVTMQRHFKLWFIWNFFASLPLTFQCSKQVIENDNIICHCCFVFVSEKIATLEDQFCAGVPEATPENSLDLAPPAFPRIGYLPRSPIPTQFLLTLTTPEHWGPSVDSSQFVHSTLTGNRSVSRLALKFSC